MWLGLGITGRPTPRQLRLQYGSVTMQLCSRRAPLAARAARSRARLPRRRWQSGREDETWRKRSDRVDDAVPAGDVTAEYAEAFCERAFHDSDAVRHPITRCNASTFRAVKPDCVDLVEVCQCAVLVGQITDLRHRGEVAVHRVDRLERDQLAAAGADALKLLSEVADVVVAEHTPFTTCVPNSLDHRRVVQRIGEDHAVRNQSSKCGESRLIGHVSRGEQESRFFAVQACQLPLELDVEPVGPRDVARPACAGTIALDCLDHLASDHRVLAHAEVVVAAPDGDDGLRPGILVKAVGDGKEPARRARFAKVRYRPSAFTAARCASKISS